MQMEWLECGAASLVMVLPITGNGCPLNRRDCGVSRDGSNAKNILRAARNYGLTAQGFRMEPDNLKTVPLPCIIHWNLNHFIVFRGFKGSYTILNDPARGSSIKVPKEEFDRSFTGITLTFEPAKNFEKGGKAQSILGFASSRMRGMLLPFVFIILTGILGALIGVINPVFSRIFMDNILSGSNPLWLPGLLGAMFGAALIQFAISLLRTCYFRKTEGKFAVTANAGFLSHVLRLPMEFFSQRMAGDIAMRQESNQDIASSLLRTLGPQVLNLLMLILYLIVMIRYSLPLALVGAAAALINAGIARIVSQKRIAITPRCRPGTRGSLRGPQLLESI
jgi:ABC-type bacteriocin/lantibiotic exporter with double-glycine peptidase domain